VQELDDALLGGVVERHQALAARDAVLGEALLPALDRRDDGGRVMARDGDGVEAETSTCVDAMPLILAADGASPGRWAGTAGS
jgi:hypothetical protein